MQMELVQPPQDLPPSGTQWGFLLVTVLLWGYFVSSLCWSQLWSEITGESQGLPRARSSLHSHWYAATRVRLQPWKPLPKCAAVIKANKIDLPERAQKQKQTLIFYKVTDRVDTCGILSVSHEEGSGGGQIDKSLQRRRAGSQDPASVIREPI